MTLAAIVVAFLAQQGGTDGLGFYLLAAYALGQGLNIFMPHLAATIASRTYVPGLATGFLFVLPASSAFLANAFSSPAFDPRKFLIVAAVFIPTILLSIPVLLKIGRVIEERMTAS